MRVFCCHGDLERPELPDETKVWSYSTWEKWAAVGWRLGGKYSFIPTYFCHTMIVKNNGLNWMHAQWLWQMNIYSCTSPPGRHLPLLLWLLFICCFEDPNVQGEIPSLTGLQPTTAFKCCTTRSVPLCNLLHTHKLCPLSRKMTRFIFLMPVESK